MVEPEIAGVVVVVATVAIAAPAVDQVGSAVGSFAGWSVVANACVVEGMAALGKCVADCVGVNCAVVAAVAAQGDRFDPSALVFRAVEDGLSAQCRP